jgi:hypothetical protein
MSMSEARAIDAEVVTLFLQGEILELAIVQIPSLV